MTSFLVLFDIDGTLVHTGRAGMRGLARAFDDLFHAPHAIDGVPFAGRTDRAIVTDALERVDCDRSDTTIEAVRRVYCVRLAEEIQRPVEHPKCVLPGVAAALDVLDARADVAVGLLTGNFAQGAEIKLGYFDLWQRFLFGAFGDAHTDRRDLVPLALERARGATSATLSLERVVVIGDTPLDIDCAHAHGARAIAVATGPFDAAALTEAGGDVVIRDLTELPAAWEKLGSSWK